MDLVSRNVRGAVLGMASYVTPIEAYMSWARFGFTHPEYPDPVQIQSNPSLYNSWDICSALSRSVNWSNQEQASRGLRALSQIVRSAACGQFDDESDFAQILDDIRVACKEDGFEFQDDPRTISQTKAIPLDELNLEGLSTTDGIYAKIKKINRALTNDRDNLEVIGFSKDLMEATAGAILKERGHSEKEVRGMNATTRCSQAMAIVGITTDNGSGKIAQGLTLLRKAMNKLVEGASEMRREDTDEGHGMPGTRFASDGQAQLALSTALLWCHYVLDKFHEGESVPF